MMSSPRREAGRIGHRCALREAAERNGGPPGGPPLLLLLLL